MTTTTADPRPLFRSALVWAHELFAGVTPDQLADPTPCAEFDVRAMMGHLTATVERGRLLGLGEDVADAPEVITGVDDDAWPATLDNTADRYWQVWNDAAVLDRAVVAPWGTFPGRAAILVSLNEVLVHGWDLAVATGQPAEADPVLAQAALSIMQKALPESPRGGYVPFGPVVTPAADAGATERLANWAGRVTAPWRG
ncbi:TIGR03086 family metal-binding protein [Rhodococcus phenolicus]|uniref:TIGR03086 family metal-binding protein n=1 Tax=Rhodococcus phenolicus TaxID=263849 RepID=UPI0008373514|nr:TIGR03086 family metal-binding protein [Rhodococcus phenolicus]